MVKKYFYITAFTFFGILLQFFIHELVEIWYIGLLVGDFPRYGLGLSWSQWFLVHHILAAIFFAVGAAFGFFSGKFWWKKLYENNKADRGCWRWKNRLFCK